MLALKKLNEIAVVKSVFHESNSSAGARTISDIATNRGMALSRYRAGNLMSACGLKSSQQPKHAYRKAKQEHIEILNLRPHQHNEGLALNVAEEKYWI